MPVELRKQPTLVESFLLRLADLRIRFRVRLFRLASWLPRCERAGGRRSAGRGLLERDPATESSVTSLTG